MDVSRGVGTGDDGEAGAADGRSGSEAEALLEEEDAEEEDAEAEVVTVVFARRDCRRSVAEVMATRPLEGGVVVARYLAPHGRVPGPRSPERRRATTTAWCGVCACVRGKDRGDPWRGNWVWWVRCIIRGW
jgi:hypothetical protein